VDDTIQLVYGGKYLGHRLNYNFHSSIGNGKTFGEWTESGHHQRVHELHIGDIVHIGGNGEGQLGTTTFIFTVTGEFFVG
jgi:hypothetical protein